MQRNIMERRSHMEKNIRNNQRNQRKLNLNHAVALNQKSINRSMVHLKNIVVLKNIAVLKNICKRNIKKVRSIK